MPIGAARAPGSTLQADPDQVHFRALARRINEGNCILVLGPGASIDSSETPENPLNVQLAKKLAESKDLRRLEIDDLDVGDLRLVSQALYELKPNAAYLQEQVTDFYGQYADKTTAFHNNIAALPFRYCVTTTPDDFLYNAFLAAGKSPIKQFYNFRRSKGVELPEPSEMNPLVYHLYGYVEEPDSLVITENDLIDFLVNVARNEPPLPLRLRNVLSREESSCLFIDLGFKNWYLRVLLRSLGLRGHAEMSLALEGPEFFAEIRQHQTTVYFSASKTIEFRPDSLHEFVGKLRDAYDLVVKSSRSAAPMLPAGAPRVFLSYSSTDRGLVERLSDMLHAGGIATYQDKQNLRAGDNWNLVLTKVIEKEVNYVVVVQTPEMTRRVEGYFYDEIRQALERQKNFRQGARFVIPVQAGGAPVLPELAALHSIPIDTTEGIENLARAILEDWSARGPEDRQPTTSAAGS